MASFAGQIHDCSMPFALLEMVDRQFDGLMLPYAAGKQDGKQCPVSLAFEALVVRCLPQRLSLLRRQPVPQADSEFLHALDASNTGGQIGAEEAAVGCLVGATAARQPADTTQESARA